MDAPQWHRMTSTYIGVSWVRVGLAAIAGDLFTRIQIPKQTPHTAGLTHLAGNGFTPSTGSCWRWLSYCASCRRGRRYSPVSLVSLLGIYLAFLTAYVNAAQPMRNELAIRRSGNPCETLTLWPLTRLSRSRSEVAVLRPSAVPAPGGCNAR